MGKIGLPQAHIRPAPKNVKPLGNRVPVGVSYVHEVILAGSLPGLAIPCTLIQAVGASTQLSAPARPLHTERGVLEPALELQTPWRLTWA